jgi:hypothetical protein
MCQCFPFWFLVSWSGYWNPHSFALIKEITLYLLQLRHKSPKIYFYLWCKQEIKIHFFHGTLFVPLRTHSARSLVVLFFSDMLQPDFIVHVMWVSSRVSFDTSRVSNGLAFHTQVNNYWGIPLKTISTSCHISMPSSEFNIHKFT